jgi:RimJ/RimL family protein N-acetyltransferase
VDIHPLDPDDLDRMKQALDLINAVEGHDAPWRHPETLTTLDAQIRYGWDLEPSQHFVGEDRGRIVAHGTIGTSELDNLDLAWFEISVPPDLRRRGHGSEMLRFLEATARERGRTKVGGYCWDGSPGEEFATHHGYPKRFQSINRRQHLAEVSPDRVRALHAAALRASEDYEVLHIEGRTPADLLDDSARMAAAINDAPLDDLDVEDEVFTPERVAAYETAQLQSGMRLYRGIARHRDTGELAGNTVMAVEAERPHVGHQQDTSVVRAHRGHRLGLLLKTDMMLWLAEAEPGLQTVDTFNAESNDHMIAVNEELGYRWMGRGLGFQRTLDPTP